MLILVCGGFVLGYRFVVCWVVDGGLVLIRYVFLVFV